MKPLVLAVALLLPLTGPAAAADLVIGRAAEHSSIDPLFSRTGTNQMTAQHMFDRLIDTGDNLEVRPGLATSWTVIDPLTWELKLRPDVRFHDGTPFTAEDVSYSLNRAKNVPNSPAPFSGAVTSVASTEIVDPLTIRIRTTAPAPLLMEQIGLVFIMPHKLGAITTQDLNAGRNVIGTGPYRFREWVPNDRLVLTANPDHWSGKPAFDTVTVRFIKNDGARVAALLSGAVQLIDAVPPADIEPLEKNQAVKLFSTASARIIYMAVDAARDKSPFVTDKDGKAIDVNPLKDKRVRLALSKLINRKTIVERALNGAGEPAGQMVPEGLGGYDAALVPHEQDLAGARALLTQAGYPNGFGLTVHASNDRIPGDDRIGQVVGQMLARGGIKVNAVVAQPYNIYAPAATRQEFSFFLFSFGATTGSAMSGFVNVLATYDREAGMGAFNRTRYSSAAFDAALKAALAEFDEGKRDAHLRAAARVAADDVALLPLYWPKVYWAGRGGITYRPNKAEDTLAMSAAPPT